MSDQASFKGENFVHQKISGTDFTNLDLKFSSFSYCQFFSCNFSQAKFNSTLFRHCQFIDCCFSGVDFSDINLKTCSFSNTLINLATFQQIKNSLGHDLIKFDLIKSNLKIATSLNHYLIFVH